MFIEWNKLTSGVATHTSKRGNGTDPDQELGVPTPDQSCPRVTFLEPDPAKRWSDPTRLNIVKINQSECSFRHFISIQVPRNNQ